MSYITAIGTAVPSNVFPQNEISRFMEEVMARDQPDVRRKIRAVFRASGISSRYSVLTDYGKTSDFSFYPNSAGEPFPSTADRMTVYRHNALALSLGAYRDMQSENPIDPAIITHLIVVSCTGMYAPGLDIEVGKGIGLSREIPRTCIQFMGCYAAFNALRVADAICKSSADQTVLIVCTELCSIHFQRTPTDDNILANALFADGSVSMLVRSNPIAGKSLSIRSFHSVISEAGSNDMAWNIGDEGFCMRLSSYIPELIRGEVGELVNALLSRLQCRLDDVAFFGIHPGGVKILEAIRSVLGLNAESLKESYNVLKNYGNMSSATVVFVLKEIFKAVNVKSDGNLVLAMGFGPGLTLESALLQVKYH